MAERRHLHIPPGEFRAWSVYLEPGEYLRLKVFADGLVGVYIMSPAVHGLWIAGVHDVPVQGSWENTRYMYTSFNPMYPGTWKVVVENQDEYSVHAEAVMKFG